MSMPILVLGAFGAFGHRIVDALISTARIPIIAAGRRVPCSRVWPKDRVLELATDAATMSREELNELGPAIVIDAAGPFQGRDRRLAAICIELGIHYIDLADGREFVAGVGSLDAAARRRGVLVISGASTVPALTSAVIDHLAQDLSTVEDIDIGIAPGYSGPRGLATIRSILGYVGRPIPVWRDGRMGLADGWTETRRHGYPPPVGARYLSLVDVPDTQLSPPLLPGLKRISVRAGLEVSLVHTMLNRLGVLVHLGLITDLARYARVLRRMATWFDRFGSDSGAMHVRLQGLDADGAAQQCTWTLIAERGDGPQIPATAAVLLAKKLLGIPGYSRLEKRGAMPAVGLLSLHEFEREWLALAIRTTVTRTAERAFAATEPSRRAL
jgi:hypothetical protein